MTPIDPSLICDLLDPDRVARAYQAPATPPGEPLRLLSLFSGCGGMDTGFEGRFIAHSASLPVDSPLIERPLGGDWVMVAKTRFTTVFANDILPEARAGWLGYMGRHGHDASTFRLESVVDMVKAHNAGVRGLFPADIDVVTGGFPCQDFSLAGKRQGFQSQKNHLGKRGAAGDTPSEETRGKLYFWMKQVIDITRPKVFVAENVKGLVNLSDVKDIIQRDFSSAADGGYIVLNPRVLHAADYGVPENRERVIFIGLRRDALRPEALAALDGGSPPAAFDPYPPATHFRGVAADGLRPAVTTAQVLDALPEPESSADLSQMVYSRAKYLDNGSQGQIEIRLDAQAPTIRSEHHGNIEFRRLSEAHGGLHRRELAEGKAERRLTPRECALIQTFPPDFPFVRRAGACPGGKMSASGAYKVIGNAVPPMLAFNIAARLQALWPKLFI